MRCSIIRRVSTDEQAKKASPEHQKAACLKSIQERGWTLVKDFYFEGVHGYEIRQHPLYLELKDHIARNECDVIMTYVLDRTLRDTYFWLDLCEHLQKYKKQIATPSQIYDTNNLEQELFLNISASIGHFERKKIKERAKMGIDALKDGGEWTGGTPPFGYQYNPASKRLEINPNEAETLKKILEWLPDNNRTLLCKLTRAQGLVTRSGENFTPRIIRRLLEPHKLLFYSGRRPDSRGNLRKANWEPIIDENQYNFIISLKKSRRNTYKTNPAYLLTGLGIFRCGYCERSIKTCANRSRPNFTIYYYCSAYTDGKGTCQNSRTIAIETVDKIILDDIIHRVQNWKTTEKALQNRAEIDSEKQGIIQIFQQQKAELSARKEKLIEAVEKDLLSYAEIEKRMKELRENISLVDYKLTELYRQADQFDIENLFKLENEIINIHTYDLPAKREIIALLIDKIVLYEKNLYIIYKFPVTEDGKNEVRIKLDRKKKLDK